MPPLTLMIKPVSGACNMRCSYCFYVDEMAQRDKGCLDRMTPDTASAVIRRALMYAEGSLSFVFQGGEPTLAGAGFYRDWLREVVRHNVRKIPVHYALQTNGLDVTDEMLSVLKDGGFLVGVSLDGSQVIHDSRRLAKDGAPTFERISDNINRLQARGIPYNILTVVDDAIADRPEAVFEALRGHKYLQFIPCLNPLGEASGPLTPERYGRFLVSLFDLYDKALVSGRYVSISLFDNWIRMQQGLPPESCGLAGVCAPNYLVESDGSVYPCDFYALDEWLLGNVLTDSFFRLAKSPRMQTFLESAKALAPACTACPHLSLCRGGCRRDRQVGPTDSPGINRLCPAFRHFFSSRGDRLKALAEGLRTGLFKPNN